MGGKLQGPGPPFYRPGEPRTQYRQHPVGGRDAVATLLVLATLGGAFNL